MNSQNYDAVLIGGGPAGSCAGAILAEHGHRVLILERARFDACGRTLREGIENMRKLVYAFHHPEFSFREVIQAHPEAASLITDCLSGDVNREFSRLWSWIGERVPLPEELPCGRPALELENLV